MKTSSVIEPYRQTSRQAGFTLVEMMITTILTLVALAAALGALDGGLLTQEEAGQSSEMNRNLRASMNDIMRDFLVAAGHSDRRDPGA